VEISGLSSAATADLVIVAVPKDFYPSIPANLLKGKVVVDVSNRATIRRDCTE
jgi:predicted dinucleotide-binding enzyme